MHSENKPRVSVWMTTFNHESFISTAIESVLMQQTSFRIELVIGEDCSTDRTREILLNYKKRYPELIVLVLAVKNQGMMRNAINTSLKCTGEYIAILEGDDYWTDPLKLQKQVEFLDSNQDYGLVWTDVDFYSQSTGNFKRAVFKNNMLPVVTSFKETLINKPFFAPPTWLFRREFLPTGIEDYCDGTFAMVLDMFACSKIKFMNVVTATYRQLEESASHSKNLLKRYNFLNGVYRIQKEYVKKYNVSEEIGAEIDTKHFRAAFPYSVILKDKPNIEHGRIILTNTRRRKDMKVEVILFLSKFYLGVFFIKMIYENESLKRIFSDLKIFK